MMHLKMRQDLVRRCTIFFGTGILLVAMLSCGADSAPVQDSRRADYPEEMEPSIVTTDVSEEKMFEFFIHSTGKIKPVFEQRFFAESGGLISWCDLPVNANVLKNQLLLQYDLRNLQLNLERARHNFFNTSIEYESELMGFVRANNTAVSDTIRRKVEISSGLAGAKLDLQKAELEVAKSSVYAPFTGRVANVNVQAGMYVDAGDELFTIYSDDHLYVDTNILETDFNMVRLGQSADVVALANASRTYKAVVSEINPLIDENGLVRVKLKLLDVAELVPGMNASVTIRMPQQKTLAVPKEAVVVRSGKSVVFTYEEGRAIWNYVETGRDNGREVEIRNGIAPDVRVITSNNLHLAHDAPVREILSNDHRKSASN